MNVENELKKDGITVIKPLDTLSITLIAKFVAEKFMSFFPIFTLLLPRSICENFSFKYVYCRYAKRNV